MTGLLAPAIWTVVVALTLWPPFRRGRPGFAVYVLTMTINELPLVFILVTAAGAWLGAGARPGGAAGVAWWAMWAFVIGGLVWVQARAGRARTALERAFAAGLGEGWRSSLRADLADLPSPSTPWIRGMLLPFQRGLPGVERVRDVPYGPDPAHLLDVYHGPAGPGPRPVLLHFHEGGFVQGRKSRESVTLLNQLASHGWLCLSANYRLREEGGLAPPPGRRQASHRLGPRACRRPRGRPRRDLPRRRLRRGTHRPERGAHQRPGALPARLRGRRHLGAGCSLALRLPRRPQRRSREQPLRAGGTGLSADAPHPGRQRHRALPAGVDGAGLGPVPAHLLRGTGGLCRAARGPARLRPVRLRPGPHLRGLHRELPGLGALPRRRPARLALRPAAPAGGGCPSPPTGSGPTLRV